MNTKTCTKCNKEKLISDFYKDNSNRLRSYCKYCCCEVAKIYYQEHKKALTKRHKKYIKEHLKDIYISYKKHWKRVPWEKLIGI